MGPFCRQGQQWPACCGIAGSGRRLVAHARAIGPSAGLPGGGARGETARRSMRENGRKPIFCWCNVNRTERQIEELLQETVERFGCQIWGVEFFSAGKRSKLKIYIDKPDGVSIDDCEVVSREIGAVLDVEDMFGGGYTLEVSSPGLDRILFKAEQFEANVGAMVDVRLNFPFDGRKRFVGLLANVEDAQALVRLDDTEYVLPLENVQRARLVPQFD